MAKKYIDLGRANPNGSESVVILQTPNSKKADLRIQILNSYRGEYTEDSALPGYQLPCIEFYVEYSTDGKRWSDQTRLMSNNVVLKCITTPGQTFHRWFSVELEHGLWSRITAASFDPEELGAPPSGYIDWGIMVDE